jgi:hypothetical protein
MGLIGGVRDWWLRRQVRAIAEGKKGKKMREIYWRLAGYKTYTGIALGALYAGFMVAGYSEGIQYLLWGAGFLTSVGLLDKAWRAQPPLK